MDGCPLKYRIACVRFVFFVLSGSPCFQAEFAGDDIDLTILFVSFQAIWSINYTPKPVANGLATSAIVKYIS